MLNGGVDTTKRSRRTETRRGFLLSIHSRYDDFFAVERGDDCLVIQLHAWEIIQHFNPAPTSV